MKCYFQLPYYAFICIKFSFEISTTKSILLENVLCLMLESWQVTALQAKGVRGDLIFTDREFQREQALEWTELMSSVVQA